MADNKKKIGIIGAILAVILVLGLGLGLGLKSDESDKTGTLRTVSMILIRRRTFVRRFNINFSVRLCRRQSMYNTKVVCASGIIFKTIFT